MPSSTFTEIVNPLFPIHGKVNTVMELIKAICALIFLAFAGLFILLALIGFFARPKEEVVFVSTFTIIGCIVFFFTARFLFNKYDPPNDDSQK